jgi:hypothetical protein
MKTLIKLLPNPHLILQKSSWKQTETKQKEYKNKAKLKTLKKPIKERIETEQNCKLFKETYTKKVMEAKLQTDVLLRAN